MIHWVTKEIPLTSEYIESLRSGDALLLNGTLYTARDKAHERLRSLILEDKPLPISLEGQIIYYCGPSPTPDGKIIGSAGPTTSARMDDFTEVLLRTGLRGMIGKGKRNDESRRLFQQFHAVYFGTFGGAGAYLNRRIIQSSVVAFHDLGAEAIYQLIVKDFPVFVVNDTVGGDLYEMAIRSH